MPLITTRANASATGYGAFLAAAASTSFESIATPVISGSANYVDFTSIPQTYKHLQIRFSLTTNATNADITLTVNGVTSAGSYTYHELRGNGSTAIAGGSDSTAFYYVATNATDATSPCVGIIDILDYTDTNKVKTIRTLSGKDTNGGGSVQLLSGMNKVTTAVTSMRFDCGSTIATTSKIALYGIKGAA